VEALDGASARLAGVGLRAAHRVGRYGVDVAALDAVAVPTLEPAEGAIFLIDEIGKMECLSDAFVGAVARLLASGCPLIATIAERGGGFIEEVKRTAGIELWRVTPANRDQLPARAVAWLEPALR
jgi:nucleoside-triphosphatase